MTDYQDVWYRSEDGLRLYARDYGHEAPRATLLCMHGLTRNSADFEDFCAALHADYRLIAVDQRGRGRSDYDPNKANYQPAVYVRDMATLLQHLGVERVVAVGTSMGGLMTMLMAATTPQVLQAAVLNDIGPVVEAAGIERIKGYVGKSAPVADWDAAAEACRAVNGDAFPDFAHADWLAFARRTCRETGDGRVELAYDAAIADSLTRDEGNTVPPDLWGLWDAMAPIPTLVVRGALSDLLSPETVAEMARRKPDLEAVTVPQRGHAPMLTEQTAMEAIRDFLARQRPA